MVIRGTLRRYLLIFWALLSGALSGCRSREAQVAVPEPPLVPISCPIERQVTDYADFTGRTSAVQSVNVVARVTGYLVQMPFQEGADVKAGDLLFQIDPKPYEAQVRLGEAQVATNEAQLEFAKQNLIRVEGLSKEKGVSQQEFDQYKAAQAQAQAQLDAAKANLDIYRLNLQYTRVTSPIDGQVSRYFMTLGNLISQDQTILTTVVSLDPIYAYFDVDQRTLLRIRKAINEGKLPSRRATTPAASPEFFVRQVAAAQSLVPVTNPGAGASSAAAALALATLSAQMEPVQIPVFLGVAGANDYNIIGRVNFSNNQLNPTTGSIVVRGVFSNLKPPHGVRLMSPGMLARIRLSLGPPHLALLVIDRAIQSDQGQKFVYIINAQNKTEYRPVVTGAIQDDGLRVIISGLSAGDRIAVGALQQLRPNMAVTTQETDMLTLGAPMRR